MQSSFPDFFWFLELRQGLKTRNKIFQIRTRTRKILNQREKKSWQLKHLCHTVQFCSDFSAWTVQLCRIITPYINDMIGIYLVGVKAPTLSCSFGFLIPRTGRPPKVDIRPGPDPSHKSKLPPHQLAPWSRALPGWAVAGGRSSDAIRLWLVTSWLELWFESRAMFYAIKMPFQEVWKL